MFRDIIDYQESVRDRTRWIEVGPGPRLLRVPAAWDPAYDPLDEISLVAYAMLPFCAFAPNSLPAIPPEAQHLASALWDEGFAHSYQARAFMRAITCCGGLKIPSQFQISDDAGGLYRESGTPSDNTGAGWRSQPAGRAVTFRAMLAGANPPPDEYEVITGVTSNKYAWGLGLGTRLTDEDTTGAFNYPPAGSFLGDPTDEGTHIYGARVESMGLQTISRGTAEYQVGTPPDHTFFACESNQYPDVSWMPGDAPSLGVYDNSGPTDEPFCFPNPSGGTDRGNWMMAAYELDALSGMFMPVPPAYYMGEPFEEFIVDAFTNLAVSYPGWDTWRARVAEYCFDTPDWTAHMLPFYRSHRARLSTPGTPSQHWQRMPLYLPWQGVLEYRIWQRVMYLRGTLWNPYRWFYSRQIAPLPPGVLSVSGGSALAHGSNGLPVSVTTDAEIWINLIDMNPGDTNFDTPEYLSLDNTSFPIAANPPYVP